MEKKYFSTGEYVCEYIEKSIQRSTIQYFQLANKTFMNIMTPKYLSYLIGNEWKIHIFLFFEA